jgi:hypothetical protein
LNNKKTMDLFKTKFILKIINIFFIKIINFFDG